MIRLVRTRNFPKEYQVVRLVPSVFRKNFTNVLNVLSHTIAAEGCFITCFFYKHIKFSDEARLCLSYHKIKAGVMLAVCLLQ